MRIVALFAASLLAAPALAESDELTPVPAAALSGRSYSGQGEASEIQFINATRAPVRLNWIAFDGVPKFYAQIDPGVEAMQPTFVSHRWLITRQDSDAPVTAFISTRSDVHGDGQAQIAVIR